MKLWQVVLTQTMTFCGLVLSTFWLGPMGAEAFVFAAFLSAMLTFFLWIIS